MLFIVRLVPVTVPVVTPVWLNVEPTEVTIDKLTADVELLKLKLELARLYLFSVEPAVKPDRFNILASLISPINSDALALVILTLVPKPLITVPPVIEPPAQPVVVSVAKFATVKSLTILGEPIV